MTTKTKLQSPAFVTVGDLVKLPSNNPEPTCENDCWFYAESYVISIVLNGEAYEHSRAIFVDYDRDKVQCDAKRYADKINAATEVDLSLWTRVPPLEERLGVFGGTWAWEQKANNQR